MNKMFWAPHTCAIGIGRDFAVAERLTIADAALFYVERWAPQNDIVLPPNLRRYLEGMSARPAVDRVRRLWGEA